MKTPLNHNRPITIGDRNEHQPENPEVVRKRLAGFDKAKLQWFSASSKNPLWKAIAQELVRELNGKKPKKERKPRNRKRHQ